MSNTTQTKAQELLTLLLATYPAAFTNEIKSVQPLEIGIHTHLLDWSRAQGYSGIALRKALAMYCGRTSYLYALAQRRERVSLEGKPRGRVSKTHAKEARARLLERRKRKKLKAMCPIGHKPKPAGTRPLPTLQKAS